MKLTPFISLVALLLAVAGCASVGSSGIDEAKVVARILAKTSSAAVVFNDQASAQQLVSSLETSDYFEFGVILDAKKEVVASYFRPGQLSERERFLAMLTASVRPEQAETIIMDHGVAIAIVRMAPQDRPLGYVAVGRRVR